MIYLTRKSGKRVGIAPEAIAFLNETSEGCVLVMKFKNDMGRPTTVFVVDKFEMVMEELKQYKRLNTTLAD